MGKTKFSAFHKYGRASSSKLCRPRILISTEGSVTEPQYFENVIQPLTPNVNIAVVCKPGKSSPGAVLRRLQTEIEEEKLEAGDSAWVVINRDNWTNAQLQRLIAWTKQSKNGVLYGVVVSTPKIEYWLLLHFESGNRLKSAADLDNRLKKYLPDYDKSIQADKFPEDTILSAIQEAKKKPDPIKTWSQRYYGTSVYHLIEEIFNAEKRSKTRR